MIAELAEAGYPFRKEWFAPHFEFRFPTIGSITKRGIHLELRHALEPWNVLGEEASGGATVRNVDSSVERMQVKVSGSIYPRYLVLCNGRRLPLHPTGEQGEYVAGLRYRAWQPPQCLHPNIPVHTPLVFDIVDTWSGRSIGGCTYHVSHPGGGRTNSFQSMRMKRKAGAWPGSARSAIRRVRWRSHRRKAIPIFRSRSICGGRLRTGAAERRRRDWLNPCRATFGPGLPHPHHQGLPAPRLFPSGLRRSLDHPGRATPQPGRRGHARGAAADGLRRDGLALLPPGRPVTSRSSTSSMRPAAGR